MVSILAIVALGAERTRPTVVAGDSTVPRPASERAPTTPRRQVTGPIDINTATASELETLPRVGPALAARIVAFRETHGRFASVEALDEVKGIGPRLMETLRPRVRVAAPEAAMAASPISTAR